MSEPNVLFIPERQIKHLGDFIWVILPLAHNSGNWGIKAQKTDQCVIVDVIVDVKPKGSCGGTGAGRNRQHGAAQQCLQD